MLARFCAVLVILVPSGFIDAQVETSWPRLRGANADGVSADDRRLPDTWSTTENVAWKVDVPGLGWGSPIICNGRVFVTSVVADGEVTHPKAGLYLGMGVRTPEKGLHHWMVYCYSLESGEKLWEHEAHRGEPVVPRHPKSSYAAETPVTDGERLYVLFGDLGVYCYDLDGNALWNQPITPQKTFLDYGAAASPVVHGDQLFVVYDNVNSSWLKSFDVVSGNENWSVPREETHSWATPFVWQHADRTELVVPGRVKNRSYSMSGGLLWEFDGRMSGLVIPSPFAAHGMCYIASGYVGDSHRPVFAVKPGANGEFADRRDLGASEFIAWYLEKGGPYNTTPLVYGDRYYTLYDRGFLTCHDAKTGVETFGKQRFQPTASFTASPWAYNGKIFCLSENGLTFVLDAADEFNVVEKNDLDELTLATPSVADGKLLVRTASKVYCITNQN